jgi:nucleotide-binding universal stress UspA family protein
MSYKSILVQSHGTDAFDARLRLAVNLAGSFDAGIIGVAAETFLIPVTPGVAYVDGALYQLMQDDLRDRLKAADARFRKTVGAVKGGLSSFTEVDYPERAMVLHACGADLVIAGRPVGEQAFAVAKPSDVIMQAGRPVLLAPEGRDTLGAKRVVLAWKDTREARRAVADALPFLKRSDMVSIVGVSEGPEPLSDQKGLKEIAAYLERHGIACATETADGSKTSVARCLHDAAERHGADLIVAGAYGHSRIREWAFGGVTRDLIDASAKFVLFSH